VVGARLIAEWRLPQPKHVLMVILENRAASQILGSPQAPYINSLVGRAAVFTQSFAVAHPSQPNYLALFSGDTHGVADNRCPLSLNTDNLAQQLRDAGKTFIGYSEGLPAVGFAGCSSPSGYVRKHAPWANFAALPEDVHQPMSAFPNDDLERLPTLAIVIPNLENDMHDGSIAVGDAWLKTHLDRYVQWAMTHDSLLVVTWDEDDLSHNNRILTMFYGPMVRPGMYERRITHYDVLRTLEGLLRLRYAGRAESAATIRDVWQLTKGSRIE